MESTAWAHPGDRIGDLNVLWEFEEGLRSQTIPAAINRAPYYFSNWDEQLDSIRETGKLQTMYPADLALPMAAPRDLGKRSEEHTSELQSLMRISYAVFGLKKKI